MKKNNIVYKCSNCGYSQSSWLGRCPLCSKWNTFIEAVKEEENATNIIGSNENRIKNIRGAVPLNQVESGQNVRIKTNINELDNVLGGGLIYSSSVLIGGEPGIGKSTLLLQIASNIATETKKEGEKVLYVSGEEAGGQIKDRALRLEIDCTNISLLCTNRLEDVLSSIYKLSPILTIIDSIQTINSLEAGVIPGSVAQLKYCANEVISWIKEHKSIVIMACHVTKDGNIAGPRTLEHLVDTVIYFERTAEDVRFLRSTKNRFGSIDTLGIFNMTEKGLKEVLNPASMFLTNRVEEDAEGVACTCIYEGRRCFLVEIQALVTDAKASISRVFSEKIESGRVNRISAILERQVGIKFFGVDIYVNVAGGVRLKDVGLDLSLALAIYSARCGIPIPSDIVCIGELSLSGEVRSVDKIKVRANVANSLGFNKVYARDKAEGVESVKSIRELIRKVFGGKLKKSE